MRHIEEGLGRIAAFTISMQPEAVREMRAWQWGQGVALFALMQGYECTGDEQIPAYVETWLDDHLKDGMPGRSINTTAPVLAALCWMKAKGSEKYVPLCETFAKWCMQEAPRSLEEAYEHSCTENVYPNEIWADTLFMGCIFLVEWGVYTGDRRFIEEAARQFHLHYKYLGDPETGLIYHGYYGNEGKQMGVLWGRGNGWYAAATAYVLPHFEGLPEYEAILGQYRKHAEGALFLQAGIGAWRTVLDVSDTYEEMSVTAAFTYGYNEGLRKGLLTEAGYRTAAVKAVDALLAHVDREGRVLHGSGGTCVMPLAQDYQAIPYRLTAFTQGLAMLALCSELKQTGSGQMEGKA